MNFSIDENKYKLDGEEFNNIFEDSKRFTNAAINFCEESKYNNRQVLQYLMSMHCHLETLMRSQIDKLGEEKFVKTIGGVKLEEDDETI